MQIKFFRLRTRFRFPERAIILKADGKRTLCRTVNSGLDFRNYI